MDRKVKIVRPVTYDPRPHKNEYGVAGSVDFKLTNLSRNRRDDIKKRLDNVFGIIETILLSDDKEAETNGD
jgi:hypothetical protein